MNKRLLNSFIAITFLLLLSGTTRAETFIAYLSGAQQVPAVNTNAYGIGRIVLNEAAGSFTFNVLYVNLTGAQNGGTINIGEVGVNGMGEYGLGLIGGSTSTLVGTKTITPANIALLRAHRLYINISSTGFPNGEIRGQLAVTRPVDFDGDGRTDPSIRDLSVASCTPPSTCQTSFHILNSTAPAQLSAWGIGSDLDAPGDYDGDGRTDLAVYRPGAQSYFYVLRSSDGTIETMPFGVAGDEPVQRDYDADGKTDFAVFRRGSMPGAQAFWYIRQSALGMKTVAWGMTGGIADGNLDLPVPGDYDGDGKFDIAVYRTGNLTPNNTFLVLKSSDNSPLVQQWGNYQTDRVVPGDYDGDGKTDFAVVRSDPSSIGTPLIWYIRQSSNGNIMVRQWGLYNGVANGDLAVQGDYDGDGRTDSAVVRYGTSGPSPTFNYFYILRSLDNNLQALQFGVPSSNVVNAFDVH